jgi:hypothetical protein
MNPLRKWRETHLATRSDLLLEEEDEEEDLESSKSQNISAATTPLPDTDSESADSESVEHQQPENVIPLPGGPSNSPNAPKKGLFGFLKTLSQESKIPKLGQKVLDSTLVSKIPKPIAKLIKPASPNSSGKVPLLSKLYNLSKREPALPKIDFANLKLFDNPEVDEFTQDLEAQKEIQRFLKKYTVRH